MYLRIRNQFLNLKEIKDMSFGKDNGQPFLMLEVEWKAENEVFDLSEEELDNFLRSLMASGQVIASTV